jgi:hypothetical protein
MAVSAETATAAESAKVFNMILDSFSPVGRGGGPSLT